MRGQSLSCVHSRQLLGAVLLCQPGWGWGGGKRGQVQGHRGPARLTHLLLCMSRCLCRENGVRNRALHSSHWNGLSSEWVCGGETESGGCRARTSSKETRAQGPSEKEERSGHSQQPTSPGDLRPPQTTYTNTRAHGTSNCPFTFLHQLDVSSMFIHVHT